MSEMFHYEGFSNPNGTIVPDDVIDVLMPQLTDPELRVLLYIIRRTFGFKRDQDNISLKQMVEGITTKDGRILDRGTGISKASVARGLKGLGEKGIITVKHNSSAQRGNEPTTYALRFRESTSQATQPLSQIETPPLSQFETPLFTPTAPTPLSQSETPPCLTGETRVVSPVRHTTNSRQQTEKQETDFEASNFRIEPSVDNFVDKNRDSRPPVGSTTERAIPLRERTTLTTDVAETTTETTAAAAETRERLLRFVQDFGREFNDGASLRSSTTRMVNIYRKANVPLDEFIAHLYRARSITQERTAAIRAPAADEQAQWKKNKMGYFFSVLQNQLRIPE